MLTVCRSSMRYLFKIILRHSYDTWANYCCPSLTKNSTQIIRLWLQTTWPQTKYKIQKYFVISIIIILKLVSMHAFIILTTHTIQWRRSFDNLVTIICLKEEFSLVFYLLYKYILFSWQTFTREFWNARVIFYNIGFLPLKSLILES